MQRYFWGVNALACLIILSACQRPPDYQGKKPVNSLDFALDPQVDSANEEITSSTSATFGIKGSPDSQTHIVVKVASKVVDGKLTCRLITEDPEFPKDAAWSPLPFKLVSPAATDGKPDPTLSAALEKFSQGYTANNRMEFLSWFRYGSFYFKALWRIYPIVGRDPSTQAAVCMAKAEICDDLEYDQKRDIYTCASKKWEWIKLLNAEGALGFRGKYIKRIIGEFRPEGSQARNMKTSEGW